jgi:hypothetical protein
VASPEKSGHLATACQTRICQGESLDQGESVGDCWAEGGSPRRAVNGSEIGDRKVVDGGVDERLPELNFSSISSRARRRSSQYPWLGQRRSEHTG